MKTYTIIGGVNGTGKSSLAGVLRTQSTDLGFVLDVDKIQASGSLSAVEAGRMAVERIQQYMSGVIASPMPLNKVCASLSKVISETRINYF